MTVEPLTPVSTRLPTPEADYLIRVANHTGMSVAGLIRELLVTCVHSQVVARRFRTGR